MDNGKSQAGATETNLEMLLAWQNISKAAQQCDNVIDRRSQIGGYRQRR